MSSLTTTLFLSVTLAHAQTPTTPTSVEPAPDSQDTTTQDDTRGATRDDTREATGDDTQSTNRTEDRTRSSAPPPRRPVDATPESRAVEEGANPGVKTSTRVEGPEPAPAAEVGVKTDRKTDVPPAPQWKGTGLLVTSGVLGALGLGTNIARMVVVRGLCKDVAYDPLTKDVSGGNGCINGSAGMAVLGGSALGFNVIAFGAAAGGGNLRGTWAAHDTVYMKGHRRAGGVQLGVGAGLMAVGLLGYAAVRIVSFADLFGANSCGERYAVDPGDGMQADSEFARCVRTTWGGYLAGITVTQAASVVGVGLLAHGAAYRRNLKFYKAVSDHQVRVRPSFAPTWAGLSLTGRF